MQQTNQANLNQPFEFEEVLVEPQTRRSFQHTGALEGAFNTTRVPSVPPNTPTRRLAVRLRTINNACEAPFQTADGRPVTEVSLYGSRERQFLVGPLWAVKRLMEGKLPGDAESRVTSILDENCKALESVIGIVGTFLSDPETGSTRARLEKVQIGQFHAEYTVRTQQQIDLSVERIDEIHEFSRMLHATLDDLKTLREEVEEAPWWWEWTTMLTAVYDEIKELGSSYREQRNRLRTPDWPRLTSNALQPAISFLAE